MISSRKAALWLLIGVAVAVVATGFIMPLFARPSTPGRQFDNMSKIVTALKRYAGDHGDQLPDSLQTLVPQYLPTDDLLWDGGILNETKVLLQYFPGHKFKQAPRAILLTSLRNSHNHYRFVAYTDETTSADFERPTAEKAIIYRGLGLILMGVVLVLLAAHFFISQVERTSRQ